MTELGLGPARLMWTNEKVTLVRNDGTSTSVTPGVPLGPKPLSFIDPRAVLATRDIAVLADGERGTLSVIHFGREILGGFVVGDRAALVGRETVILYEFASGEPVSRVGPGGASRSEMAVVIPHALAVPFNDRFVVLREDGACAVHLVQSGFPMLIPVGGWFLAGGGSLLVLASGEDPERAETVETQGSIRPELAAFRGNLAAVPSRDHIYIIDGAGGTILGRAVEGRIESAAVAGGMVTVRSGGNHTTVFDRAANRISGPSVAYAPTPHNLAPPAQVPLERHAVEPDSAAIEAALSTTGCGPVPERRPMGQAASEFDEVPFAAQAAETEPAAHEPEPSATAEVVMQPDKLSSEPRVMRVFFGTDRRPTGNVTPMRHFGGRRGDFSVGVCEVSVPSIERHKYGVLERPLFASSRGNPEKHFVLLSVNVRSPDVFASEVSERMIQAQGHEALVFVHGYNQSFAFAALRTAQLAQDLGFHGVAAFYSWPSWNSFLSYIADGTTIDRSIPHLATFLVLLAEHTGADRIHVIAHSMGNRGLIRALPEALRRLPQDRKSVFQEIVLAAPDVDAEVFKTQIVPQLCPLVRRTTLYASSRDCVLRLSRILNRAPRLGYSKGGLVIAPGLDTIDASETDTSVFSLGHSIFSEVPPVVADLSEVLKGVLPIDRPRLLERPAGTKKYWWFRP